MTIKTIVNEIEERINQLNIKTQENYKKTVHARLYGTREQLEKLHDEKCVISSERLKLESMLRAAR